MDNNHKRSDYLMRDAIMKLLSDEEVARVSTAETLAALVDGDEFLDLEHLDRGVREAPEPALMGHVLPRKAVHSDTWAKIVVQLRGERPGTKLQQA